MARPPHQYGRLKRELENAAASAAVSMNIPAPPPKEEEVIPDLSEIVKDRKMRLLVARKAAELGELSEQISKLEKQQDTMSKELKKLVGTLKIGKAISGEWRINYYGGVRKSIKAALLLAAGITQATINACTKQTDTYTLKVTRLGEKEEEGGEDV